jgi:hypothetical protein
MKYLLCFLVILSLGHYVFLIKENGKTMVTLQLFGQNIEMSLGVLIGVNLLDGILLYYIFSEFLL